MKEGKLVLDSVDMGIIRALQRNGRESYKKIARSLGVSDGTVRLRTERMIKEGYLRIAASVNPTYFENTVTAMIGLNLERRADAETMSKIMAQPGVQSVVNVTGRYDLMVEIAVSSRKGLRRFLVDGLSDVGGLISTESFVYLEAIGKWVELKEDWDLE